MLIHDYLIDGYLTEGNPSEYLENGSSVSYVSYFNRLYKHVGKDHID